MRPPIVLAVLVLLASPGALGWAAKGFQEPDTRRDVLDGHMLLTTPTTGRPVYFNGFLAQGRGPNTECALGPIWPVGDATLACDPDGCPVLLRIGLPIRPGCATPSVGIPSSMTGAAYSPYPPQPLALLGVWRDCNRDGYIGYGDFGLWEYRSQLLLNDPTCLAEPLPTQIPVNWFPSHNDGVWVREFLPIGWNDWGYVDATGRQRDLNVYDVNDSESRVWADWGLPGAKPPTSCFVYPVPGGTLRQTGGMIEWADCLVDFRLTDAMNSAAGPLDSTPAGQLSFYDAPRNQSGSTSELNRRNPWGSINDKPFVETCNSEQAVLLEQDPVFGFRHSVKAPTPGTIHEDGSVAGQLREAYLHNTFATCDWEGYAYFQLVIAELPYMVESNIQSQVGARQQTDLAFHYYAGTKPSPAHQSLGKATPSDLGARYASPEGLWRADAAGAFARPPLVSRERIDPAPVQYLTYYAWVGSDATTAYALSLPANSGTYGTEACGTAIGAGQPVVNDWQCDPAAWWPEGSIPRTTWLGPDGPEPEKAVACNLANQAWACRPFGVTIGQPYRLRDVDCFDASTDELRREGIHAGIPSGTRCEFV